MRGSSNALSWKQHLRKFKAQKTIKTAMHHYHIWQTQVLFRGKNITVDVDHLPAAAALTLISLNLFRMVGEGRKPPPLPPSVFLL